MVILSKWLFGFAGAVLMAAALMLIGYGTLQVVVAREFIDQAVLNAIGYIVIAVAVFDVSKYLIEEEVLSAGKMREAGETRQRLTRFIATILVAILLEAIVIIFKTARDDVSLLLYPALLILSAVVLLVGLGAYQRMSATVEGVVGEEPKRDDAEATRPQ